MNSFSSAPQYQTMSLAAVLGAPLLNRAEMLSRLFSESSLKDLAAIYPVLLEDIFGFGGRPGWNIQIITRKCHPREFEMVRSLLQPTGALFSVIYRLMTEPHITYEFPAACLPAGSAGVSALSAGQWSLLAPQSLSGAGPAWGGSLMLSPFELYLHHFCYFLLNPAQQAAQIAWSGPGDALYPCLLEDLMTYFLPCGQSWVPPLSTPTAHHHPHLSMSPEPQRVATPPRLLLRSCLLRPSSPAAGSSSPGGPGHHVSPETWRSETLLTTMAAFWLETAPPGTDVRPTGPPAQNDSFSTKSVLYEFDSHIPSHDQVRVVRMLVKHVHFFLNAPHHAPGLDEFKRQTLALVQKRLYAFLRHTFKHWPTDTSFRLVLEVWLSYIQPWRYTDITTNNRSPGPGQRDTDKTVERRWADFVAGNLLFYSAVFRQLLPRFHRMDLTVPKYAYMVFRMAKVMCQPGLPALIREAESLVENKWHSRPAARSESSLLSPASVGQHILDLEEAGFTYQSMFDHSCCQQVQTLLRQLREADAVVQQWLATLPTAAGRSGSLWSAVVSVLVGRSSAEITCGEYTPEETRRCHQHISSAVKLLSQLYNLEEPEPGSVLEGSPSTPGGQWARPGGVPGTPYGGGLLTPSALQSPAARHPLKPDTQPGSPWLSEHGRRQLLGGWYRADVSYRGDPDCLPVQSTESGAVLRLLLAIAKYVNTTYGEWLSALYKRADFAGYLARQVLRPPATFYRLARTGPGRTAPRAESRPARLSLRPLADLRLLAALAACLLAALAAGLPLPAALLLLLLLLPLAGLVLAAAASMVADRWRSEPPAQTE